MRTPQTEPTPIQQNKLIPGGRRTLALALASAVLTLLSLAPGASADLVFGGSEGSGAGQTNDPRVIALDRGAGLIYVTDLRNNRVDVFKADGSFLRAFGWGVADGTTPALQTCTTTCFKGIGGGIPASGGTILAGGAGEFSEALSIAVDNDPASPAQHDVYVTDGPRVQRFSTDDNGTPANPADDTMVFEAAWGGGVISAGASGKGDLTTGSATITNVEVSAKRFYPGQRITAPGKIPAGTRIVGLGNGTITLSQPATASGAGVAISAPEGAGHVAVNEVQELFIEFNAGGGIYGFRFPTPAPGVSVGIPQTKTFTWTPGISAATIQAQLEELSNIDPGDVAVSGPAGGPYTVEFTGRYADTNVPLISGAAGGEIKKSETLTVKNGASAAEICTPANAADCSAGVRGKGAGQFSLSLVVATGPSGAVYVGDDHGKNDALENGGRDPRLQSFEADGTPTGELPGIDTSNGLVVEADGDFFAAGIDAVHKHDPAGTLLSTINPSTNIRAIALDPAGNLYVADPGEAETAIYEYDSAGNPLHTFYGNGTLLARPLSLAPYSDASGDLFALQNSSSNGPQRIVQIATEPPGPVVLPFAGQVDTNPTELFRFDTNATKVTNLSATLNTRVNPEGTSSTVHFQYVDDASFEKEGGFASPKTVTTPESAPLGSDFFHHNVSFEIPCAGPGQPGCLAANTVYHLRAVATNAEGTDIGPEASFKTLPPITLGPIWSTEVSTDSARLHAALNPNGIAAKAHFEYVEDASFNESGFAKAKSTPSVEFGAGNAELSKNILISSLQNDTIYHYRYFAEDFFGSFTGPEQRLRTLPLNGLPREDCPNQQFRSGASANLSDCRAYELVSPLDKNNGDIRPQGELATTSRGTPYSRVDQAAPEGEAITYSAERAFAGAEAAPWNSQYISRRDPATGWSTQAVNPPRQGLSLFNFPNESFFKGFSEDLCSAWFTQDTDLALVPGAPPGVPNLYRRKNCGEGGYELLSTVAPTKPAPAYGKASESNNSQYYATTQGYGANGAVSVFKAPAMLTPDASEADIYQTYLHDAEGNLHVLSVLPNGKAAKTHSSLGTGHETGIRRFFDSLAGAISADASRVFWSAEIQEPPEPAHQGGTVVGAGPSRLYLRINPTKVQSKVSKGKCTEAAKACTLQISEGAATFKGADPQATKALYMEGKDLYELDVNKAIAYEAGAATLIAHNAAGVLGQSEDLARVYFGSEEDLDGSGPALAGKPNLYLREADGGTVFVATLGSKDGPPSYYYGPFAFLPVNHDARVSPDGMHALFMSRAPLTGYDNTDAQSGTADSEVFLYDAAEGKLRCISCNPSGARPLGRDLYSGVANEFQVAAQIHPWETSWHASRVLSDDGSRAFFESLEALSSRDTNGKMDVYEWQPAESRQQCLAELGGEVFATQSEGCLGLISSGKSAEDAEFIDASASGSDVFFTTASSLVPQDYGLIDVYDARINGGFPPPPGPPADCEGEACQIAPPPPNDQTPASAGFKGPGNLHHPARCRKGKARRHGRCVKRQAKKQKHKRANHKRRARR